MQVDSASITDTGHKRPHNEDFVLAWVPEDPSESERSGSLFVVADGVGGGAAGEVASAYAADKVCYAYYAAEEPDSETRLVAAVAVANLDIHRYNAAHPEQREMGTTLVAAVIRDTSLLVANVGDSRAYLVRDGSAEQLTADHNVVAQMLARGEITAAQAATHPQRSRLTRCLGAEEEVGVDVFERALQAHDAVVLCSDGLTRHVHDEEIGQAAAQAKPADAARDLVELAKQRGGLDNISVVVVRVGTGAASNKPSGRQSPPAPDLETTYQTTLARPRRRWPFGKR
jgi:serine/threonine protein phosphatase PrpC